MNASTDVSTAAQPLLRIQGLKVSLPPGADRLRAVDDVSLDLGRNEILCVVGESGSGKSVMSRAILGLFPSRHVQPRGGSILFEGEDLLQATPERLRELRGNRIAMIFQEPMTALNPVLRIGAQIDEVLEIHRAGDAAARRARVLELLAAVHLPEPQQILSAYPHQLSGGQRQRAMIAMALALEPDILIADEPTTALDVTTQAQILALIRELQRKKGMGVIFVTHDFGVVAEIADRIAVMQHGRLVEQGPAAQVLGAPQADYTRSLLAAVPSLTPGPKRDFSAQPVVLSVDGLNKSYRSGGGLFGGPGRRVDALSAVSFSVRRGETVGIVGESGSGKSTAARCIARLVDADSGQIRVEGVDIAALGARALRPVRRRLQMVFQDPFGSLNPRRTVGQLIAEGPIVHGQSAASAHARALDLLDMVGLERRAATRFPHEFSGGQRQRIGLARALALEPAILVADEPVSALDVSVQDQVLRLLADIRNRLGLTVLFITHDLRVAAQVCDSIVVMHRGRVVESGPVAEVYAHPAHAYTRALLAAVPGRQWGHANDARRARIPDNTDRTAVTLPTAPAAPGLAALALALNERRVSAVDLAQAALARIHALEPRLQAFSHLDADRALAHARAIDGLRAAGVNLGPLMGVPVAVKDLFTVDGMPTTAGSRLDVQDLVPPQGSFVDALLRAGCVILGKTRTTEFALGGFNLDRPPPWNPCDAQQPRMTGGSSHGSAVAMAAGLAAFTVGSDTGGSVRWPAALCGVVGYKASASHWQGDGVFPLSPELDSVGLFTRSAHDAALVQAAMDGQALRPPPGVDALTLAVPTLHFRDQLDEDVLRSFEAAVARLRAAGARIVSAETPEAAEIDEVFRSLVPADLLAFLGRERVTAQRDRLDAVAADRLQVAFDLRADDYARMLARRRVLQRVVAERSVGIDAWLTPTVPMLPQPTAQFRSVADVAAWNRRATRNTRPGNLFGQCGISLPIQHLGDTVHDSSAGAALPVGLQLCAAPGHDQALLGVACVVEDLLGRPAEPRLSALLS